MCVSKTFRKSMDEFEGVWDLLEIVCKILRALHHIIPRKESTGKTK